MRFLGKGLMLLMSIAAGLCADKDKPVFRPGPAASYKNHQTISGMTIAADAFSTRQETEPAFGKLDPAKYGILPILVIMENASGKALRLSGMRVEYIRPDHRSIEPVPADEVQFLRGIKRPGSPSIPNPLPIPGLGKKQDPLTSSVVQGRAFSAPILPPGETASGFYYFNTASHRGAILYVRGITEAATGQEIFYFEVPLE